MVDKKLEKKFNLRFDKYQNCDILKITLSKVAKLTNSGAEKNLKKV